MDAYRPKISPTRKPLSRHADEHGEEHVEVLSLAPFTSNPKLCFDDVPLGTRTERKICIKNPTSCAIHLMLLKEPPDDRHVIFHWKDHWIAAGSEEYFIISWTPLVSGSWRDVIQLGDGGRIRRDIPIVFKSIDPKTAKKKQVRVQLKVRNSLPKPRKMKKSPDYVNPPMLQESNRHFNIPIVTVESPMRRETYLVANKENANITPLPILKNLCKIEEETFEDSLEDLAMKQKIPHTPFFKDREQNINYTPLMPVKLENIQYTPLMPTVETPRCSQKYHCSTERKLSMSNTENNSNFTHSGDTQLYQNISGDTYVKDSPSFGNLASLQWSPVSHTSQSSKQMFSALDISPINTSPVESTSTRFQCARNSIDVSIVIKRKSLCRSNVRLDVSAPSAKKTSPIKRLSNAYAKKPQFLAPHGVVRKAISPKKVALVLKQHDASYNEFCNPYVLASTSGIDPFQSQTQYYDPQWVTEQIRRFKNWLNVLLLPPASLNCLDNAKIDLGRLWQECQNKEINKAPTKESASNKYNRNHLLQSLRRNARALYVTPAMTVVLSKCIGLVKNDKFEIRKDKNVHQDIGLQKEILGLLLCYNPLWLRIGLETVYNVEINLRSNSDVCRLTRFLMDHFFNEPVLLKRYKGKFSPKYVVEIKRHVTIKFLSLLYFLDKAKQERLVQYDPCLFSRYAEVKDSNEMLLRFCSALFSSIRDVVKPLKYIGFTVAHKQSHIQEYEYGIDDLGKDLKDGVRLVRVMEIILLKRNLVEQVRLPAISLLQKIHNVKLAFDALRNADFQIGHNIEPKDIVNGHKEKTLSFLWQIIYKFQSPRFTKAVLTIQRWFRSADIQRKLQNLKAGRLRMVEAAVKIAKWYRACKRRRLAEKIEALVPILREIIEDKRRRRAAIVIQKNFRMFSVRTKYLQLYHSSLVIQRALRRCLAMRKCRLRFLDVIAATKVIQKRWRALAMMKKCRETFLRTKNATCVLQNWIRATNEMRTQREAYLSLKKAAITIQRRYRAKILGRIARVQFCTLKNAVLVIENRYIAQKLMNIHRDDFRKLCSAVTLIQIRFRAVLEMRRQRECYLRLQIAARLIQRSYRAKKQSALECQHLNLLPKCKSVLQQRLQVGILIEMQCKHDEDRRSLQSILILQKWYRCILLAAIKQQIDVEIRTKFCTLVQRRFRAHSRMKFERNKFLLLRQCAINVQRRRRAQILMKRERKHYLQMKDAAGTLQRWWKQRLQRKQERERFIKLRNAAIHIQQFWRSYKSCLEETRVRLVKLKSLALLQKYSRGYLARRKIADWNRPEMIEQRRLERIRRKAVVKIQSFWRGYKSRSRDSGKIVGIRQRLDMATENAEPMQTIYSRTKRTEEALKKSNMSSIVNCLEDFEITTRLCQKSCISTSKYSRMIFNVITSSNRSLTHLNVCAAGASVLLNMAKYEKTRNAVCESFDGDIFLKIMSHHCDKEHAAILKFATLLWVLGHVDVVREKLFAMPNFKQLMWKMLQMCERQQKMVAKMNRVSSLMLFGAYSNLPMPSIKTDWGLNYSHAPHTFSNAVHAIRTLCTLFNVN